MNIEVKQAHVRDIRPGDTVRHAGELRTVCAADLKGGFVGHTLFGDSYRLGSIPVERIYYRAQRRADGVAV